MGVGIVAVAAEEEEVKDVDISYGGLVLWARRAEPGTTAGKMHGAGCSVLLRFNFRWKALMRRKIPQSSKCFVTGPLMTGDLISARGLPIGHLVEKGFCPDPGGSTYMCPDRHRCLIP